MVIKTVERILSTEGTMMVVGIDKRNQKRRYLLSQYR